MSRLTVVALLGGLCFCSPALSQESQVTVRLKIIVIDKYGENPGSNMWVFALPKNRGVHKAQTNAAGEVAFAFKEAESIVFRVGTQTQHTALSPLSGRVSQTTSYLDDRRPGAVYKTCATVESGAAIFPGTEEYSLLELLEDIRTQSGGRLMTDQTREFVTSLTPLIHKITTPPANATGEQRALAEQARGELFAKQQSLLAPRWRLGTHTQPTPNGALVDEVLPGSPAAAAGIEVGDTITAVGFEELETSKQTLQWMIANAEEAAIQITVKKPNGQLHELDVSLTQ